MPPSEFAVRMQRGITGGFAPPTPTEVHSLTRSADDSDSITIESMVRRDGTPDFQPKPTKSLSLTAPPSAQDTVALVDELHGILKELPVENPSGSEDIYGMDTGIMWGSDDFEWFNGGPAGCGGGTSGIQATEEEKNKFKRAVEIVTKLVD
ncbi:hypothetical protein LTR70_007446 [Exophiala xenobiotica]|uniref:Uncharacterized protein n=1 Tax=Lithohypha guttulata TaxID=1690604 RepID=A0ABR0K689_9EURO|nr:hypothetical protein LTR24_006986 [Lithohypha guttulata]KAK5313803.1 hypothetical protein LTR70_007446 [Exophiala xenobiotica]